MDKDYMDPPQGQLAHMMDFMSKRFQALHFHLNGMDTKFHGYDKRMKAFSSMITTMDA